MENALTSRPVPPIVLTIAGSDSGGGAGIQADLKTFAALGCHGCSAVTAVTAQNTREVRVAELLRPELVASQIDSVVADLPPAAVKTGMVGATPTIDTLARSLRQHGLTPLVVDPVMVSKGGAPLIDEAAVRRLAEQVLPLATVTTPNRHEAARLLGRSNPPETVEAAGDAARDICQRFGPGACVVKAVRQDDERGRPVSVDVCFDGHALHESTSPRHADDATHGSGCVFSAALTCGLAHGKALIDAVHAAKRFASNAIAQGLPVGGGTYPVNPLH